MQLAGKDCAICRNGIMLEADGTWCGACREPFHHKCLSLAEEICPTCGRSYQKPDALFVYSQFCPECMAPNQPQRAECDCGARMRWDTQKEYEDFVAFMKDEARMQFIRGVGELIGAGLCLLALIAGVMGLQSGFMLFGGCVAGFFILTLAGINEIWTSFIVRKFR